MRKLASLVGAALIATAAYVTPASAQAGSASGSCGPSADNLGHTDVNSWQENKSGDTVPALFFEMNYSGVSAPTTIGIIIRYNGELESQSSVGSFTADGSGGRFTGRLVSPGVTVQDGYVVAVSPDVQGFANSIDAGIRGRSDGASGGQGGANSSGNKANSGVRGDKQNSPTQGGLLPGEYVFYVYTGSIGDVYNVKDGTVARNAFIADEKGFLGWFSCGVSTRNGTGPG
ncbi:MAG: hypothetical protein U0893_21280 [Chloroflexota bacterium]